jgi:hypothetical protein
MGLIELLEMSDDEYRRWEKEEQAVRLPDLINAGLIVPPMNLEAEYTPEENNPTGKIYQLKATVQRDGTLKVGDRIYRSVSMAASMAQQPFHATPQGHEKHDVNGWHFWMFRDPRTGTLRKIDVLRDDYLTKMRKK